MTTQQLALLVLMIAILVTVGGAAALDDNNALTGCIDTCGNVSIPYPFGVGKSSKTGENCFLEERLNLTCDNNSLYQGNTQVLNIDLLKGQYEISFFVSKLCNDTTRANQPFLETPAFTISSKENQFISVGCNTYGYLNSYHDGEEYSTGCITRCSRLPDTVKDGECSGIGCCEVDIPSQMKNITIQTYSFNSMNFSGCSYSFVAKRGSYNFSVSHLDKLPFHEIPMVVDWTVGKENETCGFFKEGHKSACMNNSYCDDDDTSYGYRCRCKTGFDGNPYHPNGCQDIDECKTKNHTCISDLHCRNIDGSYECFCPPGQVGNGRNTGGGCQPIRHESILTKVAIGACAGLIALLGASWLYLIYQKRKLTKQRKKFFQQNGGFILQRRLFSREDSHQIAQIFTAEELKKSTNNYNESLIIGKGGFGTVFKGFLANNRIVAVKKSKVVDQNQAEQFINEVIILSQINHRN
ncbi:Wall-associated receptor kinase, galacturonan-binding domain, partial [Sesbania bispinosa]